LKRSLTHKEIKEKCKKVSERLDFPPSLVKFANAVVDLQIERHKADYDEHRRFSPLEVEAMIQKADHAMKSYNCESRRQNVH
jgi:hypothetical protein